MNLNHLSDDALISGLVTSCLDRRRQTVHILEYLREIEERRLHLVMAYSSLFDFCRRHLRMSEGQAYRHVVGARLARRYAWLLPLIESGDVCLSTLAHIKEFITDQNVHELVEATVGKTRAQVDVLLASMFNLPPRVSYASTLYMDAELLALMERARALMSHVIPDGDPLKLAKRAFRELIDKAERDKRAKAAAPRPSPAKAGNGIARAVRRGVFQRDGERCSYVDTRTGQRCPSNVFLQLDHARPRAFGGGHDIENVRVMCHAHNQLMAEKLFGREHIEARVRLRQQKKAGVGGDTG